VTRKLSTRCTEGDRRCGGEEAGTWAATFLSWRVHEIIYNSSEGQGPLDGPTHQPPIFRRAGVLRGRKPPTCWRNDPDAMHKCGSGRYFEGKHIDQYARRDQARALVALGRPGRSRNTAGLQRNEPTLVFRETASNTNERTCMRGLYCRPLRRRPYAVGNPRQARRGWHSAGRESSTRSVSTTRCGCGPRDPCQLSRTSSDACPLRRGVRNVPRVRHPGGVGIGTRPRCGRPFTLASALEATALVARHMASRLA